MLTEQDINSYKGSALRRGESFLYIPPHPLLKQYISNYTLTFPKKSAMSEQYTIMPTASSTLAFSATDRNIVSGLRGVNTKSSMVGEYANQFHYLLLIEFHPGGLYPFIKIDQSELRDININMADIHQKLNKLIQEALERSPSIEGLVQELNNILLNHLHKTKFDDFIWLAIRSIAQSHCTVQVKDLANQMYYSEKQLNRIFKQYVGTGIKSFSRIVRVNHILRFMDCMDGRISGMPLDMYYFDASHFYRDFKEICGVTPQVYLKNKSIFYNEVFKI